MAFTTFCSSTALGTEIRIPDISPAIRCLVWGGFHNGTGWNARIALVLFIRNSLIAFSLCPCASRSPGPERNAARDVTDTRTHTLLYACKQMSKAYGLIYLYMKCWVWFQRPPSSSLSYGGPVNDDVRSPGSGGTPGPLSQAPASQQSLDSSDPGDYTYFIISGQTHLNIDWIRPSPKQRTFFGENIW